MSPQPSLIDEHLLNKRKQRKTRPQNTLYVTDLTKPCQQAAYHNILHPREYQVETLRIFEAGNLLEDYWTNILNKRANIQVLGTQIPAYYKNHNHEIHGRLDILCQHNNAAIVGHEVKSAKTASWLQAPKEDHTAQIQFYINALAIDFGQVDYLDKKALLDGKTRIDTTFTVERDHAAFAKLISTANRLHTAWQTHTPPKANPNAWNGKYCDYCQYHDLCTEKTTTQH